MMKKTLKKLQNGSDIRGTALPGVPGEEVDLSPEAVLTIAQAFTLWLHKKTGKPSRDLRIYIGRDPRLSGPALLSAFQ